MMDCPPSLSPELRAGLYAADVALVPVRVDRWTLQGLQVLTDETAKIADTTGRLVIACGSVDRHAPGG